MQITKAAIQDIPQIKQLWNFRFNNKNSAMFDFLMSVIKTEDIYIAKDGENLAAMVFVPAELEYNNQKGFYICTGCTAPEYADDECLAQLVEYVQEDRKNRNQTFCVMAAGDELLAAVARKTGFDGQISHRVFDIDIKKNIWQSADFDIITASRFRPSRENFCDEDIVHYTPDSYGRYTRYMYTSGGSTAENKGACAVYYTADTNLLVKEITAISTTHAMQLLQAIRERTGCETATVHLSENSSLFLGEGKNKLVFYTKGLPDDVYINLMFE
ncbi:MAG: GNAT family N-acetyltransferase [Oscillospiraceae bacterium]|nr:GNAT family N-acetyltransferase [Oscillospiraceae bacterium]